MDRYSHTNNKANGEPLNGSHVGGTRKTLELLLWFTADVDWHHLHFLCSLYTGANPFSCRVIILFSQIFHLLTFLTPSLYATTRFAGWRGFVIYEIGVPSNLRSLWEANYCVLLIALGLFVLGTPNTVHGLNINCPLWVFVLLSTQV